MPKYTHFGQTILFLMWGQSKTCYFCLRGENYQELGFLAGVDVFFFSKTLPEFVYYCIIFAHFHLHKLNMWFCAVIRFVKKKIENPLTDALGILAILDLLALLALLSYICILPLLTLLVLLVSFALLGLLGLLAFLKSLALLAIHELLELVALLV